MFFGTFCIALFIWQKATYLQVFVGNPPCCEGSERSIGLLGPPDLEPHLAQLFHHNPMLLYISVTILRPSHVPVAMGCVVHSNEKKKVN